MTAAAKQSGIDLDGAEVFDDGDAAIVMVASEQIVILASSARAESVASSAGLVTLSIVDPSPEVTVHAVWRRADPNPVLPVFLGLLDDAPC